MKRNGGRTIRTTDWERAGRVAATMALRSIMNAVQGRKVTIRCGRKRQWLNLVTSTIKPDHVIQSSWWSCPTAYVLLLHRCPRHPLSLFSHSLAWTFVFYFLHTRKTWFYIQRARRGLSYVHATIMRGFLQCLVHSKIAPTTMTVLEIEVIRGSTLKWAFPLIGTMNNLVETITQLERYDSRAIDFRGLQNCLQHGRSSWMALLVYVWHGCTPMKNALDALDEAIEALGLLRKCTGTKFAEGSNTYPLRLTTDLSFVGIHLSCWINQSLVQTFIILVLRLGITRACNELVTPTPSTEELWPKKFAIVPYPSLTTFEDLIVPRLHLDQMADNPESHRRRELDRSDWDSLFTGVTLVYIITQVWYVHCIYANET